ncbi:hypothetical protein IMCC3088_52 [Aequoribacter fuscus]|uniref:Uncharacterized protein n=1 Tax=Aequoribacter fuscus TaxID=2518989 RepID=F3L5C1_9GAMM|nr:hypothetical protein IMCC3088_52 [Aequoribacter fuscus]
MEQDFLDVFVWSAHSTVYRVLLNKTECGNRLEASTRPR